MASENETVDEIREDVHGYLTSIGPGEYPDETQFEEFADRIEAAHKTEIKQIKFNFGQGDCVKCAEVPDESCKYYGEPDGCNFRSLANILRKAEVCEMIGR